MKNLYQFRALQSKDIAFLKDMFYLSLFVPENGTPFPRSIIAQPNLAKYYLDWGRKTDCGILVEKNDEAIGAVWCRFFDDVNKGYGFVNAQTPELGIAIQESFRNQGLGQVLLLKMFEALKNKGIKSASLSVDKRNQAFRLYQRNNFQIVGEQGTAYTMLKTL